MDSFTTSGVSFVAEQIGHPENRFKESIISLFQTNRASRAYLAQVEYSGEKNFTVALCVASESGEDAKLANEIALVFRGMFGSHEHLDILFLSESQETKLRKVCCPFFSSKRVGHPDFYLTSSEGYGLEEIRGCFKGKRLINGHPDGYMLCEIDPPIMGQAHGLGGRDIHEIVIASRHSGYSLFPIKTWPAYVHVARQTREVSDEKFIIAESDIEAIGWAELYESLATAKASLKLR